MSPSKPSERTDNIHCTEVISLKPQDTIPIENGFTTCPKCHKLVNVGTAGAHNLKIHQQGAKCIADRAKQSTKAKANAARSKFASFFAPPRTNPAPPVQPTVVQPPLIQSTCLSTNATANSRESAGSSLPSFEQPSLKVPCLTRLGTLIHRLPATIPLADGSHPFAQFGGNLDSIVPPGEDAWEMWDGPLNTVLQTSSDDLKALVARGDHSVAAFHRFLSHLVDNYKVDSALFENKVERIITSIQEVISLQTPSEDQLAAIRKTHDNGPSNSKQSSILDDLQQIEVIDLTESAELASSKSISSTSSHTCAGVHISLSSNQSPHTAYPFALHEKLGDPWDYTVIGAKLILRARNCHPALQHHCRQCTECIALSKSSTLAGIIERMESGVSENCPFYYHGAGGLVRIVREKTNQVKALRLNRLNDARKITRKATAIDDYKEWIMAVGSGKVQRVDRLVRVALNNHRGIRGLLDLYNRAAQKVYRPRGYTEEEKLKAVLLWRLGGGRVADMAHRSLELPSLSTSRRSSTIPRLLASPGQPTLEEVEQNTVACLAPISLVLAGDPLVVHQNLMLDEIKVEERPRWDDRTNFILGMCREHVTLGTLFYESNKEVDFLLNEVADGTIHLASNATVGAVGILSENNRLYGALPVLISGQCGRETGQQHAKLIKTLLDGAKKTKLRTVCIASDGESRRGDALVRLTMISKLAPTSSIYPQLAHLRFMNLEVGDDDITADKDYKHVFKRCRNLCLRTRGIRLHGVEILPSVLRSHFLDSNITERHITSILKPDDKQDVKLAYDLLSEVWRLPLNVAGHRPGFSDARHALQSLGHLFRHLLLPYICVDLSLSEQLVHLSAAAHILLAMANDNSLGTLALLMPKQLYADIMIMLKNVFFCVAKAKVDTNNSGKFYIILLGTDRLEEDFGGVRTMVGNDSGVDVLQLALRLAGATEVMTILAQHPEWDRSPRRLKLPALSKDGLDIHKHVDHIKPSSWKGDVSVAGVNLATCWMAGRREVKKLPELEKILVVLEANDDPNVNILQPLGVDLLRNMQVTEDDYDDTTEDFGNNPQTTNEMEALETGVEEAAIEEALVHKHSPSFEYKGKVVWKGRYLSEMSKELKKPGSSDRLKRYANIPRYTIKHDLTTTNFVVQDEPSDSPAIRMDAPIASILKCEGRLFVCIGEVNNLTHDSAQVNQINLDHLSDPTVYVSFQLLTLVPAAESDDPTCKNDWRWSFARGTTYRVPGCLVEAINPDVTVKEAGKPCYLFESGALQVIGSLFLERLNREEGMRVPTVVLSSSFPYREANGKACFLCTDAQKEEEILGMKQCPMCKSNLPKTAQRILEHFGAHILFDNAVDAASEPCGLCLRSSPACEYYLSKGRGSAAKPKIDHESSRCANLISFRYGVAMVAGPLNPCTNVPVACKFCREGSAAVWKYNMKEHLKTKHSHVSLPANQDLWKISNTETQEMKRIWRERKVVKKIRRLKGTKQTSAIEISDAHCSRLGLTNLASNVNETSGDGDERASDKISDGNKIAEGSDYACNAGDSNDGSESEESEDEVLEERTGDNSNENEDTLLSADCYPAGATVLSVDDQANDKEVHDQHLVEVPLALPPPDQETTVVESTARPRRTGAKRARTVLNKCICGNVLSPSDNGIIECRAAGCETRWYHLGCAEKEYVVSNWVCKPCQASGGRAAKKRR